MYDLIIIGGGPAGYTAAVYAARYKLSSVVLVAEEGGLAATAHDIWNFPSYKSISGFELMQKMKEQVENLKIPIVNETVTSVRKTDAHFIIGTGSNVEYRAKKIIIATGTKRKKLNVPGEEEFYGKGVSYCATCDAAFFKGKKVAVVGGSNSSLTSALLLAEFANQVCIIYRQDKFFRADPAWVEAVEKNEKIRCIFMDNVKEIRGKKFVESLLLESGKTLAVDGVFVEIGSEPSSLIFKNLGIKTDEKGYIITDREQKTNVKGVFAAGDITNNPLKQIVTAAAQGAVAAYSAYMEIASEKK
jgi:thioredoxin reductase (NADPH)